jgi:ABC-type lipoprotein release transport system permease subunit
MDEEPIPMAWWDYAQAPGEGEMNVELRVRGDALAMLPAVRRVVAQMDPDIPLIKPMLQREQFETTISQQLLFARLAECFAFLAIALVATGLYGALSFRVSRRTAEIGVRMALGARRSQVVWMVMRESLWMVAAGVGAGIPLAILTGRGLTSALYGIKAWDPASFGLAIVGLAVVAVAATAIPATRAASVNPTTALRSE